MAGRARYCYVGPMALDKVAGTGFHLLGVAVAGAGVLGAALFIGAATGPLGWVAGAAIGLSGWAAAYYAFREGRRFESRAAERAASERQFEILELAKKHGGALRAIDVAQALELSVQEADDLLTAMVDHAQVGVEVSSDGGVFYTFADAEDEPTTQIRVADDAVQEVEVVSQPEERKASR